jgi:hypothetical protein
VTDSQKGIDLGVGGVREIRQAMWFVGELSYDLEAVSVSTFLI